MKWNTQDIETYCTVKEYVDTALIPLTPFSLEEDIKQAALLAEFITLTAVLLERHYSGRILLLPSFTYLTKETHLEKIKKLQSSTSSLKEHFNHLFFLTADEAWKRDEEKLGGSLVLIPTISIENSEKSEKYALIESQVEQLLPFFSRKWQEK